MSSSTTTRHLGRSSSVTADRWCAVPQSTNARSAPLSSLANKRLSCFLYSTPSTFTGVSSTSTLITRPVVHARSLAVPEQSPVPVSTIELRVEQPAQPLQDRVVLVGGLEEPAHHSYLAWMATPADIAALFAIIAVFLIVTLKTPAPARKLDEYAYSVSLPASAVFRMVASPSAVPRFRVHRVSAAGGQERIHPELKVGVRIGPVGLRPALDSVLD